MCFGLKDMLEGVKQRVGVDSMFTVHNRNSVELAHSGLGKHMMTSFAGFFWSLVCSITKSFPLHFASLHNPARSLLTASKYATN